MSLPLPPLALRAPTTSDVPFITNSWLESYRDRGWANRHVPNRVYFLYHHRIIEKLWKAPGVTWMVACLPSDTTFILGWLCGEMTNAGPVLHFVYVKASNRRMGVATHLVEAFRDGAPRGFITHLTSGWEGLESELPGEYVYCPYMVFDEFRLPSAAKPSTT